MKYLLALFFTAGLALPAATLINSQSSDPNKDEFETFDPPTGTELNRFSGLGSLSTTDNGALSIDPRGRVIGSFNDANSAAHGFVREVDGHMTIIDIPGAGAGAYQGTYPAASNYLGAITGSYTDASNISHGFVVFRKWDGRDYDVKHAIKIDDPEAPVTAPTPGTFPAAINDEGEITGIYYDENGIIHAFLVSPDRWGKYDPKNIVTFDALGASVGFFDGTSVSALNDFGVIAGSYQDSEGATQPFLRDARGTFTEFDVPGSPFLYPYSSLVINNEGVVAGTYFEPILGNPFGGNYRGFIRGKHGEFEGFDAATYSPCCIFTFATSINSSGQTTGYDNDGHSVYYGFFRERDGTIFTFDAPSAGSGHYQGTQALVINDSGAIAGVYSDAKGVVHGFIRHERALHCR